MRGSPARIQKLSLLDVHEARMRVAASPDMMRRNDDPSLTISLTATGAAAEMWPDYLGVFTRSERCWAGKPVYTNTQGMVLYHNGDGDWMIGPALRRSARGSRNRHSPASGGKWR